MSQESLEEPQERVIAPAIVRQPRQTVRYGDVAYRREGLALGLDLTRRRAARDGLAPLAWDEPNQRRGGGDMRLQISPGGYLEATLLTDFAQVEADEVQVARDRFPLFFPERRPFFLNGLDVVNFGREREAHPQLPRGEAGAVLRLRRARARLQSHPRQP